MYVSMVVSSNLIWGHWKYVCLHGCAQQLNLGPLEVSVAQEYTSQFSITQLSISQSRMYEIKYNAIKYKC